MSSIRLISVPITMILFGCEISPRPDCAQLYLYRSPPLLIGIGPTEFPKNITDLCVDINYDPDRDGTNHIPIYCTWKPGDFTFNNRVTAFDLYFFELCKRGENVSYPRQVVIDDEAVSIACWLCDFDIDGDVDQTDLAAFEARIEESWIWGDANRDGKVDIDDVNLVQRCLGLLPIDSCKYADIDESLHVTDKDIYYVSKAYDASR